MARSHPAASFEVVRASLPPIPRTTKGGAPTDPLKALRRVANEISHYLRVGTVAKAYEDLALQDRPDVENGWAGPLLMSAFVSARQQQRVISGSHPATNVSRKWLRPLLFTVAARLRSKELAPLKKSSTPRKNEVDMESLVAANHLADLQQLAQTLKAFEKNGKSVADAYLLAKGMPLLNDLAKDRPAYLKAAAKLRNLSARSKPYAKSVDRITLQFIAATLEAIAPAERVLILDRCACCHRHVSTPVWLPGERRGVDGAKVRARMCELHRTRKKGESRDFSSYIRARRDTAVFIKAAKAVDEAFVTVARSDDDFLEYVNFVDHQDDEGNPLRFYLGLFAANAPLHDDARKLLLGCVGKVRKNDWVRFLWTWYRAVGDDAAAEQVKIIMDQRDREYRRARANYRPPSVEAGDFENAPHEDVVVCRPSPAPIALYRPAAFGLDLIRYEAACEIERMAPKAGRPEVVLDEARVLKLVKEGKSTRAISETLKVSAEKIRLVLKARAVAQQFDAPLDAVKALQKDVLRAKQKGLGGYVPKGKPFNVSDKLARLIAEAL